MPDADLQKPDWLLQMENILETLNEGVVITDDALRVVFTNEALLRLTGSERGEIEGHPPQALFPGEDVPYLMQRTRSPSVVGTTVTNTTCHKRKAAECQ